MYPQYLNETLLLDIKQASTLILSLPESVSEFILSEAMAAPLLELIVVSEGEQSQVVVRFQSLLTLKVEPMVPVNEASSSVFCRKLGQGGRVFQRIGMAPKVCADILRAGFAIVIEPKNGITLSLSAMAKFVFIPLESDISNLHEPQILAIAKGILAREFDYQASSESLAVSLTEIEQIRLELQSFVQGGLGQYHAGLADEAIRLSSLLQQKRQWLFRTYTQKFERPNYHRAANDAHQLENALRKLEYFELLAPAALLKVIERLLEDEA